MKTLATHSNRSRSPFFKASKAPMSPRRKLYLAIAAQLLSMSVPAWAGPEGGVVTGGNGSIEQTGTTTTINQNTDRLSIDWDSFDVDVDERVQFIQPSQDSLALNRILDGDASTILGQIDANGHVVLMNANGILFGEGASINVGGLIATGLSIDPSDFMNGDFALKSVDGSGGTVINGGVINASTGGNVALIGKSVDNKGLISAKLGTVTLAAGNESVVSFDSRGFLGVKITKEVLESEIGIPGVQNSGDIQAEGGRVLLTSSVSQDIFTKAVNAGDLNAKTSVVMHDDGSFTLGGGADVVNTGAIDVSSNNSVAGRVVVIGENITNSGSILADHANTPTPSSTTTAGSIELHSSNITELSGSSKISASAKDNGQGGDIKILGDKIVLIDQSQVSATGANGGGSILVGGDQEGKNPLVRNANFVGVAENVKVDASATKNGDGGTVITFATKGTHVHGDLIARGGTDGGDGGFIETSGLESFSITSAPNTSATNGTAGEWLIDPYNLTIGAIAGDGGYTLTNGVFTSSTGTPASNIGIGLINTAFTTNNNVTIRTGAGGSQVGDIIIDGRIQDIDIVAGTGQSLTIDAHGDINIIHTDATFYTFSTNGADLNLKAGDRIIINDNVYTNGGDLSIDAPGGLNIARASRVFTAGGDIDIIAAPITIETQVIIDTGGSSKSGNINIGYDPTLVNGGSDNAMSGSIVTFGGSFTGDFDGYYNNLKSGGSINTGSGDITVTTSNQYYGAGTRYIGGDVSISSPATLLIMPGIDAQGSVNVNASQGVLQLPFDDLNVTGDLTLNGGTAIRYNNPSTVGPAGEYTATVGGNASLTAPTVATNMKGNPAPLPGDIFLNLNVAGDLNIAASASATNSGSGEVYGIDYSMSDITARNVNFTTTTNTPNSASGENIISDANSSITTTGGNVILSSSANVSPSDITTRGGNITIDASAFITAKDAIFDTSTGSTSGQGNVALDAGGGINLPSLRIKGNLSGISRGFTILLPESNSTIGGSVNLDAPNGNVASSGTTSGNYTLTAAQDITMTASNSVNLGDGNGITTNLSAGRNLTLSDGSSAGFDFKSTLKAAGTTRISATNGDIIDTGGLLNLTGAVFLSAAGDIASTSNFNLNNAGFNVTKGNNVTLDGDINTGGGGVNLNSIMLLQLFGKTDTSGGAFSLAGLADFEFASTVDTGGGDFDAVVSNRFTFGAATNLHTSGGDINIAVGSMSVNPFLGATTVNPPYNPIFDTLSGSGAGKASIKSTIDDVLLPSTLNIKGDLIVDSAGDITTTFLNATVTGDMTLIAQGAVDFSSDNTTPLNIGNNLTVNSNSIVFNIDQQTNGNVLVGNTLNFQTVNELKYSGGKINSGSLSFTSTNGSIISDATSSLTSAGALTLSSSASIDIVSPMSASGLMSITSVLGDINSNGGPALNTSGGLSLQAANINIDNSISSGAMTVNAKGDINLGTNTVIDTNGNNFTSTASGNFNLDGVVDTSGGDFSVVNSGSFNWVDGSGVITFGGDLSIDSDALLGAARGGLFNTLNNAAPGGDVSITVFRDANLPVIFSSGDLSVDGNNIYLSDDGADIAGNARLTASSINNFASNNAGQFIAGGDIQFEVSTGGAMTLNNNGVDGVALVAGNNVIINAPGTPGLPSRVSLPSQITAGNDVVVNAFTINELPPTLSAQNVTLNANVLAYSGDISANITNSFNIIADDIALGKITLSGADVNLTSNITDIVVGDIISGGGDITLSANESIRASGSLDASTGNILLESRSQGDITLSQNISTNGNFTATLGGGLFSSRSIYTYGGDIDIDTTTFDFLGTDPERINYVFDTTDTSTNVSGDVSIIATGRVFSPIIKTTQGDVNIESRVDGITAGNINGANNVSLVGASSNIEAGAIQANNLDIYMRWPLTQTGAWVIANNTNITVDNGGADVVLTNTGNDFNHFSAATTFQNNHIQLVESNDIILDDITGFDSLTLLANNVTIDGNIAGNTSTNMLVDISGNSGANTFTMSATGAFNNFFDAASKIDLGGGNDVINLSATVPINILGGAGSDIFNLLVDNISLRTLDGGADTDTLNAGSLSVKENYFKEVRAGNISLTKANIETTISSDVISSDLSIYGVDGYDAKWTINPDDSVHVVIYNSIGTEVARNTFTNKSYLWGADGSDSFVYSGDPVALKTLVGGAGQDSLSLANSISGFTWDVSLNGQNEIAGRTNFVEIESIIGSQGNDVFRIGAPNSVVQIDGFGGVDTIEVADPSINWDWIIDGSDQGSLNGANLVNNRLDFINIANLTGSVANDSFTFTNGGSLSGLLLGGAGNDTLTISTGSNLIWNLDKANNDSVQGIANFNEIENAVGGSGDDSFTLVAASDVVSIDGGQGNNALTATNIANTWTITGANQGNLNSTAFTNISGLIGGTNTDAFTIEAGGSVGTITGGLGQDSLFVNDSSRVAWFLASQTAPDSINSAGITLAEFSEIETIQMTADTIHLDEGSTDVENIIGIINPNDTNNFIQATTALVVNLSTSTLHYFLSDGSLSTPINFSNINLFTTDLVNDPDNVAYDSQFIAANTKNDWTFIAPLTNPYVFAQVVSGSDVIRFAGFNSHQGGSGVDTLTGNPEANGQTWTVTTDYSGSVSTGSNSFNFTLFENLVGSSGDDRFVVSAVIDNIDGGGGNNTLVAGNQVNNWAIIANNSGTLNSNPWSSIQNVVGGTAVDTFTFSANSSLNSIDAKAGDDTVILANNVSINSIDGGDGANDILDLGGQETFIDFNLVRSAGTTTFVSTNFEQELVGADGKGGLIYFGGDGNNQWLIDGTGTGTLTKLDGPDSGTYVIPSTLNIAGLLGGSGTDSFVITDTGSLKSGLTGGGSNNDSLTIQTVNNTSWLIEGSDQGSVTSAGTTTLFKDIANLIGGGGNDNFELRAGGSISGSITGGLGSDILLMSDPTPNNTWTLSSVNSVGGISAFNGIEHLVSNANADTFNINATTDVINIDGGGANNLINWTGSDLIVDLINTTLNGVITVVGVNRYNADQTQNNSIAAANTDNTWLLNTHTSGSVASSSSAVNFSNFSTLVGGSAKDTLTGLNEVSTWSIDGVGQGSTTSALGQTQFRNMDALMGNANNDTFILSSLDAAIADGIVGGAGTNELRGYSGLQHTWDISSDYSGSVNGAMGFSQIQNIQGGDLGDTFQIRAKTTINNLNGGQGDDRFIVEAEAIVNTIIAGAGNDHVDVDDLASLVLVEGGAGFDTLDLTKLQGAVTLDYLGAQNTGVDAIEAESILLNTEAISFFGGDGNNLWQIDQEGSGTLTKLDDPSAGPYTFTNMLNLLGGNGNDQFVLIGAGSVKGYIDGGAANNSLTAKNLINDWLIDGQNRGSLTASDASTAVFRNISQLIGADSAVDTFTLTNGGFIAQINAGTQSTGDRLILEQNNAVNWNLGTTNQVTIATNVTQFSGVNIIDGSLGDDVFTITNNQPELTSINARTGNDTLDISGLTQAAVIDLQAQTAAWMSMSGFETFIANTNQSNTFIGFDEQAIWTPTDGKSGVINYQNSGTVNYSGFLQLKGGSASDQFLLANLCDCAEYPAVIDGGQGIDEIVANDEDTTWQLDTTGGLLNGNRFESFEILTGGGGQDDFVLISSSIAATTLNGGLGNNSLTSFDQDNTWQINIGGSGSINSQNFSAIQTFVGGSAIDTFTVAAGTTLKDIRGGDGNDTITIGANSNVDNIYGEGGDDVIVVREGLKVTGVIDGGTTSEINGDYLDISGYTVDTAVFDVQTVLGFTYTNFTDISRPSIRDTYYGGDNNNIWHITGPDEGTLEILDGANAGTYAFTGVSSIIGGLGSDIFKFETDTAAITKKIEGGSGDANTLDLSGQSLVNQWIIDGANSGHVTNSANPNGNIFFNIASIIGGSNIDTLINSSTNGAGIWTLAAIDQGAVEIDSGTISFSDIESLIGNQQNLDRLQGAGDQAYAWIIDNLWAGSVANAVNLNDRLNFSNIATVIGGANDDNFQITTKTNISVDGGGAVSGDFADYSLVNANLSINLSQTLDGSNGVITGVETIRGNNSGPNSINSSELIGSDANNLWTIADFDGTGTADGINDGTYTSGTTSVNFLDFNILKGGANADTFNQSTGVIQGSVYGNAGNDVFNVTLANTEAGALNNRGTQFIGGDDNDTLTITGGRPALQAIYTTSANGGEFEYIESNKSYLLTHEEVELINEQTLANTLELRGSNANDLLALTTNSFAFNQGTSINHNNKDNLIVRVDAEDTVELKDNLLLSGSFTLINGGLITNDLNNTSITAKSLVLESTQDVGSVLKPIRTSVDDLSLKNTIGDVYLQEQNSLNISGMSTTGAVDLVLINGNLTSTGALNSNNDLHVVANNGDVLLSNQNHLTGDISLLATNAALINLETTSISNIVANSLLLDSNQDIIQNGVIAVSGSTQLHAGNNIILDNSKNDFNQLSISAAKDATVVDQNALTLASVDVTGHLSINSSGLNIDGNVTADSISFNGGVGTFVQAETSTVTAKGNIDVSADTNVVVSTLISNSTVSLGSDNGEIIDGNGNADNILAKKLIVSVDKGFGVKDGIETIVNNINITTIAGDLIIINAGDVEVEKLATTGGNIALGSSGNIDLQAGSVSASGTNGGSVVVDTREGSVKQIASTAPVDPSKPEKQPAIKGSNIIVKAPQGDVGEGTIYFDAQHIEVIAQRQAGTIFSPPGIKTDLQFSGTFTFEDQLLVVEQFDDVSPAVFSNVKGYFYNDVSLKLSADQLYDEDEDDDEDE